MQTSLPLLRNDIGYGVRFENRNTAILVDAKDRSEAIAKARKKKKRGGDRAVEVWQLNASQLKQARAGRWVRTNSKGESRARMGYRGVGPEPKAYRGDTFTDSLLKPVISNKSSIKNKSLIQGRIDQLDNDLRQGRIPAVVRVATRKELFKLRSARRDSQECGASYIADTKICHKGMMIPDINPKNIAMGVSGSEFKPSEDARKLASFIAEAEDPEMMLERLLTETWTKSDLQQEIKKTEKAEEAAKVYGVENFGDLENLPDQFYEVVASGEADKIPPIPGAPDLYGRLSKTLNPSEALEYTRDYSPMQLTKFLKDEEIRRNQFEEYERERFEEFKEELSGAREEARLEGYTFSESNYEYIPSVDEDAMPASTREAIGFALDKENRKAFQKFNRWDPYAVNTGDFDTLADARESRRTAEIALNPSMRAAGREIESSDVVYKWFDQEAKEALRRRDSLFANLNIKITQGVSAILDANKTDEIKGRNYTVRRDGESLSIVSHDGRGRIFENNDGKISSNFSKSDLDLFTSIARRANQEKKGRER